MTPGPRWTTRTSAALLLVIAAGGLIWMLRSDAPAGDGASPPSDDASIVASVEAELRLAEGHYERAIAGLEQMARLDDEPALDPEVTEDLRRSLDVIDGAIEESRAALREQPQSVAARETLFEALQRKIGLLQDTITLINEMRKGNQAGAARIVGGLGES